jgi:hypothetical protein
LRRQSERAWVRAPQLSLMVENVYGCCCAGVSRAGARTRLQIAGHGDLRGFDPSSPAWKCEAMDKSGLVLGKPTLVSCEAKFLGLWELTPGGL